jgi:hypothetical protein
VLEVVSLRDPFAGFGLASGPVVVFLRDPSIGFIKRNPGGSLAARRLPVARLRRDPSSQRRPRQLLAGSAVDLAQVVVLKRS